MAVVHRDGVRRLGVAGVADGIDEVGLLCAVGGLVAEDGGGGIADLLGISDASILGEGVVEGTDGIDLELLARAVRPLGGGHPVVGLCRQALFHEGLAGSVVLLEDGVIEFRDGVVGDVCGSCAVGLSPSAFHLELRLDVDVELWRALRASEPDDVLRGHGACGR